MLLGDLQMNKLFEILFKGKNAIEYFRGYKDNEILNYIFKNCEKRLKKVNS